MRKTTVSILVLTCLLIVGSACRGRAGSVRGTAPTETIAAPAPQPAPTGTEAMTQTVDIEDSRSVDDGGILTNPPTTAKTSTAAPVTKTAKKKKR
ncbi:MAG: hypothetical protein ACXV5L_11485 [Thermoanaerobaculia bacterium]